MGEGGSRHQLEAEEGRGDGGRGTRVSRWRIQVDQTDRKAGSRDGRQGGRAGEEQKAGKSGRWRRGADVKLKLPEDSEVMTESPKCNLAQNKRETMLEETATDLQSHSSTRLSDYR